MTQLRPAQSIGWALSSATKHLREAGIESARLDAELLLGHIVGKDRTRLAIDRDQELTTSQENEFASMLDRRLRGESVAYLLGKREFMGHEFAVGPGVLVPRPETELMVERAVEVIDRLWPATNIRVLDLCTGSGAIAHSLALLTPAHRVTIVGSDVSPEALKYARQSRSSLGLEARVELIEGDLLTWTDERWDMILTNPPYLTSAQVDGNPDLAAEPRLALDGGQDGLEFIDRIINQATTRVAPTFAMLIEIDPDQADAAHALAASHFPDANVIILPDLTGRARFVSIERQESTS